MLTFQHPASPSPIADLDVEQCCLVDVLSVCVLDECCQLCLGQRLHLAPLLLELGITGILLQLLQLCGLLDPPKEWDRDASGRGGFSVLANVGHEDIHDNRLLTLLLAEDEPPSNSGTCPPKKRSPAIGFVATLFQLCNRRRIQQQPTYQCMHCTVLIGSTCRVSLVHQAKLVYSLHLHHCTVLSLQAFLVHISGSHYFPPSIRTGEQGCVFHPKKHTTSSPALPLQPIAPLTCQSPGSW